MHDCPECGYACYCDCEDHENPTPLDCSHVCQYDDERDADEPVLCRCGRPSCAEACEQCGRPLCPMCYELGAGFCDEHPDANYQLPSGTHSAEGQ